VSTVEDFVAACPEPVMNRSDLGFVWCRGYTFTYHGIRTMPKEVERCVLLTMWTSAETEWPKSN